VVYTKQNLKFEFHLKLNRLLGFASQPQSVSTIIPSVVWQVR